MGEPVRERAPGRLGSLRNSRLGNLRYVRGASWEGVEKKSKRQQELTRKTKGFQPEMNRL